ncbi:hypothetical protein ACLOJK_024212 [Asimina triloba]
MVADGELRQDVKPATICDHGSSSMLHASGEQLTSHPLQQPPSSATASTIKHQHPVLQPRTTHPRQRLPIFIQAPSNPSPWSFFSVDGQQQACSSSPHRLPRRPNPSPPLAPSSAVRPRAAHRLANESSTSITMPATPLSTRRRADPHLRKQLRPYLLPDSSISHHPSQIRPTNPSAVGTQQHQPTDSLKIGH